MVTRWRVDFAVKTSMVLAEDQKELVFRAPDDSHAIHLLTKRGPGKHAADELYLSAHVILEGEEPRIAADDAETLLGRFLSVLSVVTGGFYRIEHTILVVDWSPGLVERDFLYFKVFPDPNVPIPALDQDLVESVAKLTRSEIPRAVRLSISWWARGVAASPASEQFQYFWYALEILAEHAKPSVRVASKCPRCQGELFCQACNRVPVHRPYPKEAIRLLIEKHVQGEPHRLFEAIDKARNLLLHGEAPHEIEREVGAEWDALSNSLGTATRAAIVSTLANLATAHEETGSVKLSLNNVSSYTHWETKIVTDMAMPGGHADPANPQIEEFWPTFKLEMNVQSRDEVDPPKTGGGA